jgi:hypothetical protein
LPPVFALNETLHSAPLSGIILTDQCVSTQAGPEPHQNRRDGYAAAAIAREAK